MLRCRRDPQRCRRTVGAHPPRRRLSPVRSSSGREAERRVSPRGHSCQPNQMFRPGMPVRTFPPVRSQGVGSPMRQRHIRICNVAVDVVGTHPQDVVVPLQGDPFKRPREASRGPPHETSPIPCEELVWPRGRETHFAEGAFSSLTKCSGRGCLCKRSPLSEAKGSEARCASATSGSATLLSTSSGLTPETSSYHCEVIRARDREKRPSPRGHSR